MARCRPLSQWLAAADEALAEAEQRGEPEAGLPLVWRRDDELPTATLPQGEGAWRAQIEAALALSRLHLQQLPVLDREGRLLHWECPLQLGLAAQPDAAPELVHAKFWLPLAQRTGLSAEVDLAAVAAALARVAMDGQLRAVNLATLWPQAPATRLNGALQAGPTADHGTPGWRACAPCSRRSRRRPVNWRWSSM